MTDRPRIRLTHSPLVLVLAQVRMSPVLRMEAFVPEIQEALRTQGFPKFRKEETRDFLLFGPEPKVTTSHRWVFARKDDRTAVALATDFIALETTAYDMFEDFSELLRAVLEIVQGVTSVELSQRLGLRYVNFIRHGNGSRATTFKPQLLGLSADELGATELLHRVEIRGATPIGGVTVRVTDVEGNVFLPPDLSHDGLTLPPDVIAGEGPASVLDIDSYSEEQRDFDPEKLTAMAWDLHEHVERAFLAAVTPEARVRWGEETG